MFSKRPTTTPPSQWNDWEKTWRILRLTGAAARPFLDVVDRRVMGDQDADAFFDAKDELVRLVDAEEESLGLTAVSSPKAGDIVLADDSGVDSAYVTTGRILYELRVSEQGLAHLAAKWAAAAPSQ